MLGIKLKDLGQLVSPDKNGITEEIKRRIRSKWSVFGRLGYVFESNIPNSLLKSNTYKQSVIQALTFGSRLLLGIKLKDRVTNTCHKY